MNLKTMSIERRIARLEREILRLRKKYWTLYHRTYARMVRRSKADKRALQRTKRYCQMLDKLSKQDLIIFSRAIKAIRGGSKRTSHDTDGTRYFVTLTHAERVKFHLWLKKDWRLKENRNGHDAGK